MIFTYLREDVGRHHPTPVASIDIEFFEVALSNVVAGDCVAILDTGADFTVLPVGWLTRLRVFERPPQTIRKFCCRLPDGRITPKQDCMVWRMKLCLNGYWLPDYVDVYDPRQIGNPPDALIGQDVLQKYHIYFDSKHRAGQMLSYPEE